MTRPLLTVTIPTVGRATLERTLQSIRAQTTASAVEILVVGDTHAGTYAAALASVPRLCGQYGARYLAHDGGQHMFGQPQRQYGMEHAQGAWLMWSQDDSHWTPTAYAAITAAIRDGPPCPLIGQVQVQMGHVVGVGPSLALGTLDADGLCLPNQPERLGRWGLVYEGDWHMARETIALWGGQVRWIDALLAVAQPARERQAYRRGAR